MVPHAETTRSSRDLEVHFVASGLRTVIWVACPARVHQIKEPVGTPGTSEARDLTFIQGKFRNQLGFDGCERSCYIAVVFFDDLSWSRASFRSEDEPKRIRVLRDGVVGIRIGTNTWLAPVGINLEEESELPDDCSAERRTIVFRRRGDFSNC